MIALVEGLLYQQYIIQGLQSNYELINDNNDKLIKYEISY